MITVRKHNERGHANFGWLDTHHTFSFGRYLDPKHMGFRSLRVMNEDHVAAGRGFGTHPHDNMEIVTYVIEGAIEHRDSMGNGSVLPAGAFQRMTAGTGITHSEFNPSDSEGLHLYQIWIEPAERDLEPSYEEWHPNGDRPYNQFHVVAQRDGVGDSMVIHQDASISLATVDAGAKIRQRLDPERYAWLQVIRGEVTVGEHTLVAGDGAAIENEPEITIEAHEQSEVMLFDLA